MLEGAGFTVDDRILKSREEVDAFEEKHGIATNKAADLADLEAAIGKMAKRVYRAVELTGYGRIDLRLDNEGRIYVLEANPNPQIAYGEDFAESAHHAGVEYGDLLDRILALGLRWRPEAIA